MGEHELTPNRYSFTDCHVGYVDEGYRCQTGDSIGTDV